MKHKFIGLREALNYLNTATVIGLKWCSAYDFATSLGCKKVNGIWI